MCIHCWERTCSHGFMFLHFIESVNRFRQGHLQSAPQGCPQFARGSSKVLQCNREQQGVFRSRRTSASVNDMRLWSQCCLPLHSVRGAVSWWRRIMLVIPSLRLASVMLMAMWNLFSAVWMLMWTETLRPSILSRRPVTYEISNLAGGFSPQKILKPVVKKDIWLCTEFPMLQWQRELQCHL